MKAEGAAKFQFYVVALLSFLIVAVMPVATAFADCPEDLRGRAEGGDYNAQCFIGHMYLSGKGVQQDYEKARYWYQRVIDQVGADAKIIAHANLVLGVLFNSGKGGKQCYKTAMRCFENAAKQGYTDAHINIGLMYAKGLGVEKDLQKALYWWQLAEEKGHPSAAAYVLQLKKKMALEG